MAKGASSASSWEHPKKSGIRIREVSNRHEGTSFGVSYLVTVPSSVTGQGRLRKQFKIRDEAKRWAEDRFKGQRLEGEAFFHLSDQERREVASCIPLLRERGIKVDDAIKFAIKHLRPASMDKSLHAVIAEITNSKRMRYERGDLRERSYRDFRHRAERLDLAFPNRALMEISGAEIKDWLNGLSLSARTNQNYLSVAGEVFRHAVQKRYISLSPLDELTDLDRRELCGNSGETKEPSILEPDTAGTLLNTALEYPELDLLAAITLALFCGLRTEEVKRLNWKNVRLDLPEPIVTIGSEIAKKRRIRHVDIPTAGVNWLLRVSNRTGEVTRSQHANDYQKRFRKLLKRAGINHWEANSMRHSFGSYHYALHGNPLETARLLGHRASDQTLFDHYRALATKSHAQRYFSLVPPKSPKVVNFG